MGEDGCFRTSDGACGVRLAGLGLRRVLPATDVEKGDQQGRLTLFPKVTGCSWALSFPDGSAGHGAGWAGETLGSELPVARVRSSRVAAGIWKRCLREPRWASTLSGMPATTLKHFAKAVNQLHPDRSWDPQSFHD